MIQSSSCLRFVDEALLFVLTGAEMLGQKFEGEAVEFGVLGLVDDTHAALPDLLGNSVCEIVFPTKSAIRNLVDFSYASP